MEIGGAYPASYGIRSYRRTAALDAGVVTVTDSLELSEVTPVDFIMLTHVEPVLKDGVLLLAEGCTLSFDDRLTCEIEAFDPVGMDSLKRWGSEKLYRIHLKTETASGEYTFTVKA